MIESGARLAVEPDLGIDDFVGLLEAAGIAGKRPTMDRDRIWTMLANSNLIITARVQGALVGVARALTDFAFCCYVSELAVHRDYRNRGIARALAAEVRRHAGPESLCLLTTIPEHEGFCQKIGMTRIENAFLFPRRYG